MLSPLCLSTNLHSLCILFMPFAHILLISLSVGLQITEFMGLFDVTVSLHRPIRAGDSGILTETSGALPFPLYHP